jgi:hypothetical protein
LIPPRLIPLVAGLAAAACLALAALAATLDRPVLVAVNLACAAVNAARVVIARDHPKG